VILHVGVGPLSNTRSAQNYSTEARIFRKPYWDKRTW